MFFLLIAVAIVRPRIERIRVEARAEAAGRQQFGLLVQKRPCRLQTGRGAEQSERIERRLLDGQRPIHPGMYGRREFGRQSADGRRRHAGRRARRRRGRRQFVRFGPVEEEFRPSTDSYAQDGAAGSEPEQRRGAPGQDGSAAATGRKQSAG